MLKSLELWALIISILAIGISIITWLKSYKIDRDRRADEERYRNSTLFRAHLTYHLIVENKSPTAREFELNLEEKMQDDEFTGDVTALLRPEIEYDQDEAFKAVYNNLIRNL